MSIYGSPKSSSGSTPSESSGSSQPDESSSGSSGYFDSSSSGISSGLSSESSESSGSYFCSWEFGLIVLYDPLNGEFFVNNTGTVPLTVINVTIPLSYTLTPPTPVVIPPGGDQSFTVASDMDDLTGVTVTVTTDCGEQSFNF